MFIATIMLRKGLYSANEKTAGDAAPEAAEI
jgi:hypothetical protein